MINKYIAGALYEEPGADLIRRHHDEAFEWTCKPDFINAGLPLPDDAAYFSMKQHRMVGVINSMLTAFIDGKLEGVTGEDIIQATNDLLGMGYSTRVYVALERLKTNDASFSLKEAL